MIPPPVIFILCLSCIVGSALIALLFQRGWMINKVMKDNAKLRVDMDALIYANKQWQEKFEHDHTSPWTVIKQQRG